MIMVASCQAQAHGAAIDIRELNRKALVSVEKSLEAHGGRQLADTLRLSMTVVSDFINEGQSVAAVAPFETYPVRVQVKIDQPARKIRVDFSSAIAGGFRFVDQTVLKNGKGYSIDPLLKTYQETETEPFLFDLLFPHRRLLQALQNAASLRFVGNTSERDTIEAVSYATSTGQVWTLYIDRNTHLLRKLGQVLPMGIYGDGYREYEFLQYRKFDSVVLPSRLVLRNFNSVHEVVENTYTYQDVTTDVHFDPKELELPDGLAKADYSYRGSFKLNELAKDVYLLENITETDGQWSYNVLFVVFNDFVLVAEAPSSSAVSEKVLQKIRAVAPGKPVRYLVQSHHHGDHIGGIRPYVAEDVTILAGPALVPLIERISSAPFSLNPDRLLKKPAKPVIEAVEKSKTIRDQNHEVIIYNIGPSPHSREMLLTYLPSQRILYQSDMINEGEYPKNETTQHFLDKTKELNLDIQILVGLHGKAVRSPRYATQTSGIPRDF